MMLDIIQYPTMQCLTRDKMKPKESWTMNQWEAKRRISPQKSLNNSSAILQFQIFLQKTKGK